MSIFSGSLLPMGLSLSLMLQHLQGETLAWSSTMWVHVFWFLNPIHAKTDEIGKRQHEWFHKRLLGLTSVIQSHSWFSRYGLNLFDCFVEAAMRIPNLQALRTHSVPSQTNLTVLHGLDRPLLLVSTQRVVIRWKTKSLYQQPFRRCNGNPQQR